MKYVTASNICSFCGRPLKTEGHKHPILGVLGPECYTKFSGLEQHLKANGLEQLEGGTLEFDLEPDGQSWRYPAQIRDLKLRAARAKLWLEVTLPRFEDGRVPYCVLTLRASKTAAIRRALASALKPYGREVLEQAAHRAQLEAAYAR